MVEIGEERFAVIVKPNAKESMLLGYDDARGAYRVAVAAPAERNRANRELVRLLFRLLGKRVVIVCGAAARRKVLKVVK